MTWTTWLILPVAMVILILFYKIGVFRKLFGRKKKEILPSTSSPTEIRPAIHSEIPAGDVKAKMDLVLAELDSLRVQYEATNQRIQTIETMIKELYAMAKS